MKKIYWNCPICGSENVDKCESDWYGEGYVEIKMNCYECGSSWTDYYEMTYLKTDDVINEKGEEIINYPYKERKTV